MIKKNKGFTLAELLIVVAIIAVLVAIAIPVFTSQLEKSREATDLANARGAYAEVVAEVMQGNTSKTVSFPLAQTQKGWQTKGVLAVGAIEKPASGNSDNWKNEPEAGKQCTVGYEESIGVVIDWGGNYTPPVVANDQSNAFEKVVKEYNKDISGSWDSAYGGSMNTAWNILKKYAQTTGFDTENIKAWAIISPNTVSKHSDLVNDTSNLYYVWTTKDISGNKVGTDVPVIMSNTVSGVTTYTVGNVKVTYGDNKNYNVISTDGNGLRPNAAIKNPSAVYDIDTLIHDDGNKKVFTSYEEAARYYDELAAK